MDRRDVEFLAKDSTRLCAWLYLPTRRPHPLPAITMANGFGSSRWHGVDPFARAFAEAGFVVLLHDHRNFGTSGGDERGDVDPWRQISDWEDAVGYVQAAPEVDRDRIGLWGAGYAGGHALVMGATDRRLSAIVAQSPTLKGLGAGAQGATATLGPGSEGLFREDCRRRIEGEPGLRLRLASMEASLMAPYRSEDAMAFYRSPGAAYAWENEVTVRSVRAAMTYAPGAWLDRVAPTPLMVIASSDEVATGGSSISRIGSAGPAETVIVPGSPFAPFLSGFREAAEAATRWFERHL